MLALTPGVVLMVAAVPVAEIGIAVPVGEAAIASCN